MTDEPVRPTRYFDQPSGGFSAVDWRAPPSTPPTPQQAPPLWDVHSAPSPTTQFTGTAMWAPHAQVSSPAGGYYEPTQPSADVHGTLSRCDWSANEAPLRTPPGNRSSDRCHYCNQKGHWKTECPDRQQRKKAQGAYTQRLGTRTYLNISVAGRNSTCLLHTGCDLPMLPRRYIRAEHAGSMSLPNDSCSKMAFLCRATESRSNRNCPSLSSAETEMILWPILLLLL